MRVKRAHQQCCVAEKCTKNVRLVSHKLDPEKYKPTFELLANDTHTEKHKTMVISFSLSFVMAAMQYQAAKSDASPTRMRTLILLHDENSIELAYLMC